MKKILCMIIFLCFPLMINAVTMQEYQNAVAGVGTSTGSTYGDEFIYSYFWGGTLSNPVNLKSSTTDVWLKNAKNGIKSSGKKYGFKSSPGVQGNFTNKFAVYCESFVQLMVHHASNGAVSYPADYERIKVEEIRKGDLIHFKNHIAIFIDDGNDSSKYTNTVAHGSTKIEYVLLNNLPDYGYRLKESALAKLDYNYVTSSYDFHDRLDDSAPVITNVSTVSGTNKIKIEATDYKKYDLTEKSDVIEPENSGIVYYQITESATKPTTNWKQVNKTTSFTTEVELAKNGIYYVWVKDVGGNVASKQVNITTLSFDKTNPSIGNLTYKTSNETIEITITGAYDDSGIKEYRYYLNDKLKYNGSENKFSFEDLDNDETYEIYYEVVDNGNNISKSTTFSIRPGVNANKITLEETYIELAQNANYIIKPKVDIADAQYKIEYKSNNPSVATVSNTGNVQAKSPGTAIISVKVGATEVKLQVKVLKYNIQFTNSTLKTAYVGEKYEVPILTNINATINLSSGNLPSGLRIQNNKIVGTPTKEALGQYRFYLSATYEDEAVQKEFVLNVYQKNQSGDDVITIVVIGIAAVALLFILIKLDIFKFKRNEI